MGQLLAILEGAGAGTEHPSATGIAYRIEELSDLRR
jgi:hypothetical protein